jgi:hypothetical protein
MFMYLYVYVYIYIYLKIDLNWCAYIHMSHTSIRNIIATTMTTPAVDELIAKVGETLRAHLSGLHSEYTMYKQTHDTIMALPAVQTAIRAGRESYEHEKKTENGNGNEEKENENENEKEKLLSMIEALKLENDALRLQLAVSSYSKLNSSPNITLVIEKTQGGDENAEEEEEEQEQEESSKSGKDEKEEEEEEEEEELEAAKDEDAEEAESSESGKEEEAVHAEEEDEEDEEEAAHAEDEEEEEEAADAEEAEEEDEEEAADAEEADEEDEEEAADAEEAEEEDEEEEEVEVLEIKIKGKPYFTTDETSGVIYECLANGDIGNEVGEFKNGKPIFKSK